MSSQTAKKSPKDVLADILKVDVMNCSIDLYLASTTEGGIPAFQRLNITVGLATEFRTIVRTALDSWRKESESGDRVLQGFDPGAKLDGFEIEHLDLSDHQLIKRQVNVLANGLDLKVFADEEHFVSGLRFYVIMLKPQQGQPVYLFRTYTPKRELSRSTLFGVVLQEGQYDRYKDHLFLFDHRIDSVCSDERMFIVNKGNFQKIFQFYELLIGTAKATLKAIQTHIPILNFAEFAAACEGHLVKLAKLKNIASKPYLKRVTIGDIRKVIGRYKLPIKLVGKGAKQKILFESSDKWAILRLLDDDYLESVMTGANYEVNSKRPLGS